LLSCWEFVEVENASIFKMLLSESANAHVGYNLGDFGQQMQGRFAFLQETKSNKKTSR